MSLKVLSVTAFVGMGACVKAAGAVPAGQIVFHRSLFAIFPILMLLAWRKQLATAFRTTRPVAHIVRCLIGVTSMGLGFFALTRLPLPEAIVLNYAQPLLVVVFGAVIFGEQVRIFRWSAVVVGLVGVIIISWPRLALLSGARGFDDGEGIGVLAQLAAAAIGALVVHLVRRLITTERTSTIVLWFSATGIVAGLATLPFGWTALSPQQFALLVGSGIFGGVGQILMTESYRYAHAATIAPFEYTSMIIGIVVGYVLFGDVPTIHMFVGGVIVTGAGIFIIWREHGADADRNRTGKIKPHS